LNSDVMAENHVGIRSPIFVFADPTSSLLYDSNRNNESAIETVTLGLITKSLET